MINLHIFKPLFQQHAKKSTTRHKSKEQESVCILKDACHNLVVFSRVTLY